MNRLGKEQRVRVPCHVRELCLLACSNSSVNIRNNTSTRPDRLLDFDLDLIGIRTGHPTAVTKLEQSLEDYPRTGRSTRQRLLRLSTTYRATHIWTTCLESNPPTTRLSRPRSLPSFCVIGKRTAHVMPKHYAIETNTAGQALPPHAAS